MRARRVAFALAAAVFAAVPARPASTNPAPPPDPVVDALKEELSRSMELLNLPGLGRPYFLGFWSRLQRDVAIQATAGSLTRSMDYSARQVRIDLRVGDATMDNTGFYARDRSLATSPIVPLPLDPDPLAVRRIVWYQTDGLYKSAAQNLESKRAFLAQKVGDLKSPDFVLEPPVTLLEPHAPAAVDTAAWERHVRELSAVFRKHPPILTSEVVFFLRDRGEAYVSSEGTDVRHGSASYGLEVNAVALAPDGMELQDFSVLYGDDLERALPAFRKDVEAMASRLAQRVRVPMGEDYLGPLLLEGQAACELLGQMLSPAVAGDKVALFEDERYGSRAQGPALSNRLNRRVLPIFLSAVDDPSPKEIGGTRLLGGYVADQEGVIPKKISLVEHGVLKSLLMTRAPLERIRHSSGRARAEAGIPGGRTSNLIVTNHEPNSGKELRKHLLDLVEAQELPYGLVVRKLNDELLEAERGRGRSALTSPLEIVRLYPDGHEEEIRGMEWGEVSVRLLRDILAAGDRPYVYNYYQSGRGGTVLTSVSSPSLLLDEVEMKAQDLSQDRPPALPSPLSLEQAPTLP